MKLRDRKLECNIRRVARRELRQSPKQWREYRSRRWQWRRWVFYLTIIRLAVPLGMILIPVSFSFPLIVGLFNPRVAGVLPMETVEFVFGVYSVAITCLLMAIAGFNDRAYVSSNRDYSLGLYSDPIDLRVLAHLPVPDRIFCSPHSWVKSAVAVFVAVLWLGAPFAIVAWKLSFDLAGYVTTAVTALVTLLTVAAALSIGCAYSPTRRRLRQFIVPVGLALFVGTIVGAMIRVTMGDLPGIVPRAFLWLTPYGWVSATFIYGYIDGNDSAWLVLIPAVAFVLVAIPLVIEWLRSDFAIKEFVVTSSGWHGVIERGFRVPKELPEPPPIMQPKNEQSFAPKPTDATEGARSVVLSAYLHDPPWQPYQMVERLRDAALTSRECLILRLWTGSYEKLTIQWTALAAGLVACAIVAMLPGDIKPNEQQFAVCVLPLAVLYFTRLCIRRERIKADRLYGPNNGYLPIGFVELSRAAWKQELVRGILAAPLFVGYGLAVAPFARLSTWHGVLHAILPLLLAAGCQPVLDCLKLSASTNDTSRISFQVFWIGGSVALGLLIIVAAVVPSLSLPIRYAALSLLSVVTVIMWWYYSRAYRLGKFDLVARPSRLPATR
jgi:hypothetical protein